MLKAPKNPIFVGVGIGIITEVHVFFSKNLFFFLLHYFKLNQSRYLCPLAMKSRSANNPFPCM